MDIIEFLKGRRTYRRFAQKPIPAEVVEQILEAARLANSGANLQPLKYILVQSPAEVAAVNEKVKWAAALPPEQGTPKPDERPVMFLAVLQDTNLSKSCDTDAGLALGNITTAAWANGVGSCIMGAINRPAICQQLQVPPTMQLHTVVAFGYPSHKSTVVDMKDGAHKYYLDENRDYCVPKRSLEELVIRRV